MEQPLWFNDTDAKATTKIARQKRIDRLKSGNYAFGCPEPHEEDEHDEFCKFPTVVELVRAFVPINEFRMKSRRAE